MNEITFLLEMQQQPHRHGGPRPGRAANFYRDRLQGNERLMKDYLVSNLDFGKRLFRRLFRMHRTLFLRLVDSIERHDIYFQQRPHATGKIWPLCAPKIDDDVCRLLEENEKRGFQGMLGSLDYMHWAWKNFPKSWSGKYNGKEADPTIVLEAVDS
ncbi:hypothetical protein PsorP6_011480 [Peronosclerospora sorghi]|uniref:Uncharacterized protein n=1 Tax=Peronosclerospora sorghi TaxID=230839 RepID=A0ACC0WHV8_9STRA|nr:hypothetical protein PsorP6_011480 [Peronosclerospora sorghi]